MSKKDQQWLLATTADVALIDVEEPIASSISADCNELENLYQAFLENGKDVQKRDEANARVYAMMAAICGMHFRAERPKEPYGPRMTLADGRRTPIRTTFAGFLIEN